MDKPIAVGDLVQVVRLSVCCGNGRLGRIFTVAKLIDTSHISCTACGAKYHRINAVADERGSVGINITRLKRIPPMSELEGAQSEETRKLPTKEPA